jgi:Interferon-induced transmembrane protein
MVRITVASKQIPQRNAQMTEQPPGPPPGNYPPPPPPQGGGVPPPPGYGVPPDNNLVWAILVTLFCCLPFGIVSIIKSTQVSSLWAQGQHAAAQQSAADAKKWAMWGAIAGVVGIVGYLIFWLIFGVLLAEHVDSNIPTSFTPSYPT